MHSDKTSLKILINEMQANLTFLLVLVLCGNF